MEIKLLLTIVCASLLSTQTVSYETLAKRIPLVLEELESKLSRKLSFDGAFKNEVVILRAEKVEPQVLLDKIAEVTVGKWESDRGTLILRPDVARRKQQDAERLSGRIKMIEKILEPLRKELDQDFNRAFLEDGGAQSKSRQDINAFYALQRRDPFARLTMRSLLELGAERLARIEAGDRIVLATHNPTKVQLPIPNRDKLLAAYEKEREVYEQMHSGTSESLTIKNANSMRSRGGGTSEAVRPNKLENFLISIPDLTLNTGYVTTTAVLTKVTATNTQILRGKGVAVEPGKSSEAETRLAVSPLALEAGRLLSTTSRIGHPIMTAESPLHKFLMDPLKNEPLSLGSEVFVDFAKRKNLNLAVCLNDGSFGRFLDDKVTMKQFEIRNRPYAVWHEADGWLTLTPSDPVGARRGRDDRSAISALLKANQLSIDVKANYLAQRFSGMAYGLGGKLKAFSDPDLTESDFIQKEHVLRFYGSLSLPQRQQQSLDYAKLNSTQRDLARRMIYGSVGEYEPMGGEDIRESTSAMGEGLDRVTLQQTKGSEPGVWIQMGSSSQDRIKQEMKYAALEMFFLANPQHVTGKAIGAVATEFELYDSASIRYSIAIKPRFTWFASTSADISIGQPMSPAKFPAHFKAAFDQEYQKLEEMVKLGYPPRRTYGENGKETFLGTPPPPPGG